MYNIQKAVSRLDFAPKLKEIQVTDIKKGIGIFTPKPERAVSFTALQAALKKAGYTLDTAEIIVSGTLVRDNNGAWWLMVDPSGQHLALEGKTLDQVLAGAISGARVVITGDWKTVGDGGNAREAISARSMKKAEETPAPANTKQSRSFSGFNYFASSSALTYALAMPLAPIRTTTPGLTVYKGGAVIPRLYLIHQHLGNLDVSRQVLDVSVSYTPSQRVQFEVEAPFSRTSFDTPLASGSGAGQGNLTLWGKYRFYRTVKTYGDRQAAVRLGLELPTGKKSAPTEQQLNVPAYVRQQLTPISGGLSPHIDLAFSQAGGRVIFGGNIEGILRSERDGFRIGHEVRLNTDLEYVLLPRNYPAPGKELFVILETTFVQRGMGRIDSVAVPGSKSTEFYLAPGLQYAAAPRFVIEGSVQLPVIRNTGPQVLRTDRNILIGIRYLF